MDTLTDFDLEPNAGIIAESMPRAVLFMKLIGVSDPDKEQWIGPLDNPAQARAYLRRQTRPIKGEIYRCIGSMEIDEEGKLVESNAT